MKTDLSKIKDLATHILNERYKQIDANERGKKESTEIIKLAEEAMNAAVKAGDMKAYQEAESSKSFAEKRLALFDDKEIEDDPSLIEEYRELFNKVEKEGREELRSIAAEGANAWLDLVEAEHKWRETYEIIKSTLCQIGCEVEKKHVIDVNLETDPLKRVIKEAGISGDDLRRYAKKDL